ncbi:adenosine receptor A3-like [Rhopilema esculentum]|uniref:adenosine receptor A3-like n=1 Tax=Rhopilema esculentum TaxID=499914 RepID=UPI0031DBA0D0|eukprot:gene15791-7092_t
MSITNRSLSVHRFCQDIDDLQVILSVILSPINFIGSAIVLRAIHATPELRKISTFRFIANLTISDIMLSITAFPLIIVIRHYPDLAGSHLTHTRNAYRFFFDTKRFVSVFTLISLSVDKVLACALHLKYNNLFTPYGTFTLLGVIWAVSLGIGASNWAVKSEYFPGGTCQPVKAVLDVTEALLVLVCFVIIFASNLYLMILSKAHQKQDREQRRETNSRTRKIYDHYKSLKSLILLLCMFGIGLLPLICYFLIQQLAKCDTYTCTAVWEYLNILHYIDLNTRFIIYCCRFRSLFRFAHKIVSCDRLRRVRVAPETPENRKQENGQITMVDEMPIGKGISSTK